MKTQDEINAFLEGYRVHSSFDDEQLLYCMVMIYQHFYELGNKMNDSKYMKYIASELERLTGVSLK